MNVIIKCTSHFTTSDVGDWYKLCIYEQKIIAHKQSVCDPSLPWSQNGIGMFG